ncbi:MAG TPA: cytochrome C [Anaeromyxobacteraceae bacterium]|nr:cytochrome C [Anaeromyxobacteraceae bacterium]
MEHARHVFRIVLLVVVILAAVLLARGFLVPKSYGTYGRYRGDNVAEQMNARPVLHAGAASCAECHVDEAKKHGEGAHRSVSCEICHAPKGAHVLADGAVVKPPIDRSFTLCARCHRKIAGRPEKFPQVDLEKHVNGPVEGKVCLQCHDPHSPKI